MKKKVRISKKLLGTSLALGLASTLSANAITAPNIASDTTFSISEIPSSPCASQQWVTMMIINAVKITSVAKITNAVATINVVVTTNVAAVTNHRLRI